MSHNSIIQISTKPIPNNKYLSTYDMDSYVWFKPKDYDYFNLYSQNEKEFIINFIFKDRPGIKFFSEKAVDGSEKNIYFIIEDKKAYFKSISVPVTKFIKCELLVTDITNFASFIKFLSKGLWYCKIKNVYESKYGDYVAYENSKTAYPIKRFFRKAKRGVKYYIGDVVDYHW